tara:strand:- start:7334 stop:8764 length:1431 start_codon:yes stop_codon:yes gene_type:complete
MIKKPILVVDLDGTLVRTDMLFETAFVYARLNPFKLIQMLYWLFSGGKVFLKKKLFEKINFDVTTLPYNDEVLELISSKKNEGYYIVLATATYITLANEIADFLGIFDEVYASSGLINLSSSNKKELLLDKYGEFAFEYMGNSMDDLPVWEVSSKAYIVNPNYGVFKKASTSCLEFELMTKSSSKVKTWVKALRIHQWAKNGLIFLPLLAAHKMLDLNLLISASIAFILFGICASSVYLLNDLLDLNADRQHKTKRNRPFASGKISIIKGVVVFPLLLLTSFICSFLFLPIGFFAVLSVYYLLTLGYSLFLKRYIAVDVITLALLYCIRIVAGAASVGLALTSWILAFSMFIFLSLALVKRYAELNEARRQGKQGKALGRGYFPEDLELISSLGSSSGYLSVLVLALYIQDLSYSSLYENTQIMWLACPIMLFWITRIWILTHRGEMHDDPVVFAIKDKVSIVTVLLFGLIFWFAL